MKIKKIMFSALSMAMLAFTFSACDTSTNVTNTANTSNAATVVNSNSAAASDSVPPVSNTKTGSSSANGNKTSNAPEPAEETEGDKIRGELQTGKTESVILYVGMETGDYAAYCFTNDSEAGRKILAACKDKEQCEFVGEVDFESPCKVPGLEADLSSSGRISKIGSVKSLGRRK